MKTFFLSLIMIGLVSKIAFTQVYLTHEYDIDSELESIISKAPIIYMPSYDFSSLIEKDNNISNIQPEKFGHAFYVNITNISDGDLYISENKRIWSLSIQSKNALTLNLIFDIFNLADEAELFIYGDNSRLGPITNEYKSKNNKYATTLINGDKITLVIIEPINGKESYILINKVIHGYKKISPTYGFGETELDCHINANCGLGDGWLSQKRTITRILVQDNEYSCSGVLLNNSCHNFIPYVLTAFHCVDANWNRVLDTSEENDIETWVFDFLYLSPLCNPSTEPSYYPSYNGAEYRAHNDSTDFLLVQMDSRPSSSTNIKYAGWSRASTYPSQTEGGVCFHHPMGDVMKIAVSDDPPWVNSNIIEVCPTGHPCYYFEPGYLWEIEFNDGAVEGGSSGAPLFDPNHRVIGQLNAAVIDCPPEDAYYGKFDRSWSTGSQANERLSNWLGGGTNDQYTNTLYIPYVTGNYVVCYSNTTSFWIYNLPSGASLSWSVSSNLTIVSSGSNYVNVKAKTSTTYGSGYVRASIRTGSSCDWGTFQKNVWVGKFNNTVVTGQAAVCPDELYTYTAQVPGGHSSSYNYDWTYPGNWIWQAEMENWIRLKTPMYNPDYGTVRVSIENQCGWSNYSGITVYPGYCGGGGGYYMASPNPADNYIDIEIIEEKLTTEGISIEAKCVLKMVDNMGMVKYTSVIREFPYRINTSKLPDGLYIINLLSNWEIYSIHVIIEH